MCECELSIAFFLKVQNNIQVEPQWNEEPSKRRPPNSLNKHYQSAAMSHTYWDLALACPAVAEAQNAVQLLRQQRRWPTLHTGLAGTKWPTELNSKACLLSKPLFLHSVHTVSDMHKVSAVARLSAHLQQQALDYELNTVICVITVVSSRSTTTCRCCLSGITRWYFTPIQKL